MYTKLLIAMTAGSALAAGTPAHAGDARFGYFAYAGKSQENALVNPAPDMC